MINKVILIGNVGADPEVRALEGGVKVARLRIATTERIYNRQTQETKEHTEWHNVTLWRNLADVDGNKRYATEIVANDLKMLGRRGDAPASGADNSYGGSYGGAAQSSQSSPSPSGDIAASAPQEVDDLPF